MALDFIEMLGGWAWWVLGLVLLAVEVFAPGFFFLWFGIAALVIGTSALLVDWPWQWQMLGFVVLSVVSALMGRQFLGYAAETPSADPHLNVRAARLTGRTLLLAEAIVQGSGRVRVDDSVWRVTGPDLPAGSRVRVTGAEGATLTVEPEDPGV